MRRGPRRGRRRRHASAKTSPARRPRPPPRSVAAASPDAIAAVTRPPPTYEPVLWWIRVTAASGVMPLGSRAISELMAIGNARGVNRTDRTADTEDLWYVGTTQ